MLICLKNSQLWKISDRVIEELKKTSRRVAALGTIKGCVVLLYLGFIFVYLAPFLYDSI